MEGEMMERGRGEDTERKTQGREDIEKRQFGMEKV
jgi:hypothetical protein